MPTTTRSTNKVIISWTTPGNNGAEITGYKVYIREHDSEYAFSLEATECEGTSQQVIDNTSCEILLTTLAASPW